MITLELTAAEARALWLHVSCRTQEDVDAFRAATDQLYARMLEAGADVALPALEYPSLDEADD
jgi:hypothetical protein